MPKIIIKGKSRYIRDLARHLRQEHPSTRRRMEVEAKKKKRRRR